MLCKTCHNTAHDNAKFRKSVMLEHKDFSYAQFSRNGEIIYKNSTQKIKTSIRDVEELSLKENMFKEKKKHSQRVYEIINKIKKQD